MSVINIENFYQICYLCYEAKKIIIPSGNKVEFIAEGGFSKIYKATWIGPKTYWSEMDRKYYHLLDDKTVALKELNNSKNINSKELNEVQLFYV